MNGTRALAAPLAGPPMHRNTTVERHGLAMASHRTRSRSDMPQHRPVPGRLVSIGTGDPEDRNGTRALVALLAGPPMHRDADFERHGPASPPSGTGSRPAMPQRRPAPGRPASIGTGEREDLPVKGLRTFATTPTGRPVHRYPAAERHEFVVACDMPQRHSVRARPACADVGEPGDQAMNGTRELAAAPAGLPTHRNSDERHAPAAARTRTRPRGARLQHHPAPDRPTTADLGESADQATNGTRALAASPAGLPTHRNTDERHAPATARPGTRSRGATPQRHPAPHRPTTADLAGPRSRPMSGLRAFAAALTGRPAHPDAAERHTPAAARPGTRSRGATPQRHPAPDRPTTADLAGYRSRPMSGLRAFAAALTGRPTHPDAAERHSPAAARPGRPSRGATPQCSSAPGRAATAEIAGAGRCAGDGRSRRPWPGWPDCRCSPGRRPRRRTGVRPRPGPSYVPSRGRSGRWRPSVPGC